MRDAVLAVYGELVVSCLENRRLFDQPMPKFADLCRLADSVIARVQDFEFEQSSLFESSPKFLGEAGDLRLTTRRVLEQFVTHGNNTTDLVP